MEKQRDVTMDICKGVGILLVVAGHAELPYQVAGRIYLFHLPLFFFISGYFMGRASGATSLVVKKTKTLLIPALAFYLSTSSLYLLWGYPPSGLSVVKTVFLGGKYAHGIYWYPQCLFLSQVALMLICFNRDVAKKSMICFGASLVFIACLSQLVSKAVVWQFGEAGRLFLPWNSDVIPAGMLFLLLGKLAGDHHWLHNKYVRYCGITVFLLALTCFDRLEAWSAFFNNELSPILFNMKQGQIGVPVLSQTVAAGGAVTVFFVSSLLARIARVGTALAMVGQASWTIMCTHQICLGFVARFAKAASNIELHASLWLTLLHVLLTTLMCLCIDIVLRRWRWSRSAFLGGR